MGWERPAFSGHGKVTEVTAGQARDPSDASRLLTLISALPEGPRAPWASVRDCQFLFLLWNSGTRLPLPHLDLCLGFRLAFQTLLLRNKEHTAGSRQVVTEEIVGMPSGGDCLLK